MNIKEKIIKEYPLKNKINCELNCYRLAKKRYLVFWEEIINKNSIEQTVIYLQEKTLDSNFTKWKTLIVVGRTNDEFNKDELVYFNNVGTFVVFYLIDQNRNKLYINDSWIFALGCNYKKYVKKINSIVKN